jgi:cell division protein ZapA
LNIADELVTLRARYEAATAGTQSSVRSRAGSLMGMLDEVLEERMAS